MTGTGLELRGVRKSFDDRLVLDDISLVVRPGEFVSIVGPSGAGKSTILNLLTGRLTPDGGEMLHDGVPLASGSYRFAFMPQRDALLPWLRIIDNTTLGLEVAGMKRKAARARVAPLFAEFGLDGFERHFPAQLSGGMRQRAALLRTVVQGKAVLLVDEPFGALDALTRTQMQQWLAAMWMRHRWTALLITHDVREAALLSDRVYVLSARPARIARTIPVGLPHPRPAAGSPEVAKVEAEILNTLFNPEF
jgi:ABC-type nitrate/sulfonate/bicarbonate transport system ATPase subunit